MNNFLFLEEGEVYYSRPIIGELRTFRRITGLIGKHVIYSDGGDLLHCCKKKKFLKWMEEQS